MKTYKFFSALFLGSALFLAASKVSEVKDSFKNYSQVISLNGNSWKIAVDSANSGREKGWFKSPPDSDSRMTLPANFDSVPVRIVYKK
jgi:hypothetical protein